MAQLHAFTYRVPRFAVAFPVEFVTDHGVVKGRTCNISDTGLLVQWMEPILPGVHGFVRMRFGAYQLQIAAVVTHLHLFEAGLRFCFSSPVEQEFAKSVVQLLAERFDTGTEGAKHHL